MDDLQYAAVAVAVAAGGYYLVLNLVINGWPSIPESPKSEAERHYRVLNLVINGWPSIRNDIERVENVMLSFKPCYKWMTFNTLLLFGFWNQTSFGFKPCYKWMTFNTLIYFLLTRLLLLFRFKPCYKWMTFNT